MMSSEQIDRLGAGYEHDAIGREFDPGRLPVITDRRQHAARRNHLLMAEYRESLSDSQCLPKSAVRRTCNFETRRVSTESMVSLVTFIVLSALAGFLCALVISYLNTK